MLKILAALIFLLGGMPPAFAGSGVFQITVKGTINPGSAAYVLDSLALAESQQADLFVLRLDTPGGLLSSTRSIIQGIRGSRVPVAVWVGPAGASATSAGALITMSAHISAMAAGTNIGAAHPVGSGGEDVKGDMGEKVVNDTAALARSLAALRGRDAAAAELIVTKSKSYSAKEAVDGKVVDFVAEDLDSLLALATGRKVILENPRREAVLKLGTAAALGVRTTEMNLKQYFLHLISDPNVSAMLLTLAGLAMWAEVSSGFSSIAAGVIGIMAFILGMISLQNLPINVGGAVLLVLGFVLLVLEAFVTSYGLLAIAAIASFFMGGLFLIDPAGGSMRVSLPLLISMVAALSAILMAIGWALSRERMRPFTNSDPVVGMPATVVTIEAGGHKGTALVNGEIWNFETQMTVAPRDYLHVARIEGLRIFLERKN